MSQSWYPDIFYCYILYQHYSFTNLVLGIVSLMSSHFLLILTPSFSYIMPWCGSHIFLPLSTGLVLNWP